MYAVLLLLMVVVFVGGGVIAVAGICIDDDDCLVHTFPAVVQYSRPVTGGQHPAGRTNSGSTARFLPLT